MLPHLLHNPQEIGITEHPSSIYLSVLGELSYCSTGNNAIHSREGMATIARRL